MSTTEHHPPVEVRDGGPRAMSTASSRGPLAVGCLLVLLGVLCNRWSIERVLARDEYIESGTSVAAIWVFQCCLVLCGLWICWKRPAWLRSRSRAGALGGLLGAGGFAA